MNFPVPLRPSCPRLLAGVLVILLSGLLVTGPPARAESVTGGYAIGTTATCATAQGVLVGVRPPAVSVRMRSAWARAYKAQRVRVTARLQGRTPAGWTNVTTSGAVRTRAVLVPRSYVTRSYRLGALPALTVPPLFRDDYRAVMRLQWYSPRTGRVEGAVTKVVGRYLTGAVTSTTCRAASGPSGIGQLSAVGTAASGQVKVTFTVGSAPMAQQVQCRPSCGNLASTDASAEGHSGRTYTLGGLSDGQPSVVDLRSCLAAHPTICSTWTSDAATPYGAIPTPTLSLNASGQCIQWAASGGVAGKQVTVVVRLDGAQIESSTASAAFARSGVQCVGYSQTRTISVSVYDSSVTSEQPVPRSAASASKSATTPAAPAKVTVGKTGNAQGMPGCFSASCAYLQVTLENFSGPVTCSAHQNNPNETDWTNTYNLGNGVSKPGWYYGWPGSQVWVVCGGVESNHFTW
jgi:hypothetical protein